MPSTPVQLWEWALLYMSCSVFKMHVKPSLPFSSYISPSNLLVVSKAQKQTDHLTDSETRAEATTDSLLLKTGKTDLSEIGKVDSSLCGITNQMTFPLVPFPVMWPFSEEATYAQDRRNHGSSDQLLNQAKLSSWDSNTCRMKTKWRDREMAEEIPELIVLYVVLKWLLSEFALRPVWLEDRSVGGKVFPFEMSREGLFVLSGVSLSQLLVNWKLECFKTP